LNKLIIAALVPALFLGCSKSNQQNSLDYNAQHFFADIFSSQNASVITVLSADNQPLAGAQVLIGDAEGTPFTGNFLTADSDGQVALPAQWTTAQSVTVAATGYVRTTYLEQQPGPLVFNLNKQPQTTQYEVTGSAQDLPIANNDGFIDLALNLPGLSKQDMMIFDLSNIISSQNDSISTLGQTLPIPSNISLPNQSEKYLFLKVTLNKPVFRVYYTQPGMNRLYAVRARFPFKTVVDALRGGSNFLDILNTFTLSGGVARDVTIAGAKTQQDMPMTELNFTDKKTVAGPTLGSDEAFMVIGAFQQDGYMMPSDVKRLTSGESISLNNLPNGDQYVLGVLKKSADFNDSSNDRMSTVLLPFTEGVAPQALPLIEAPTVSGNTLSLPSVASVSGVNALGTFVRLSAELKEPQGATSVTVHYPVWEVYASGWINQANIPQWPQDQAISSSKRWEVSFIGSQTSSQSALGPAMMEAATHVTHNSVSF